MLIRVDTREQTPLKFECETVTIKLDFADYSCVLSDGYVVPVVFERKSVADLYGTMAAGYSRFKNEIIRCQEAKFRMILLIEGSLTKVSKGIKHSQRNPESLLAQVFTLWVKYGIFPVFAKDPEEAAKYILLFYTAYEKKYLLNRNTLS
jgi:ERCC4-type nuclease